MNKPRKNIFIFNWTDSISGRLTNKRELECRDWGRMNTKQLYWFTPMRYIQSSPKPRWNSLNHNSNNHKHHRSWTLQELWYTCWKTLFQHTHSLRNPIKKSVPSRTRALTKSRSKSTPGVKVNTRRCLGEETPSASVARARRRLGKASPRWRRRPTRASPDQTVPKQGNRRVVPRYPWVGKTMVGATPWEGLRSR